MKINNHHGLSAQLVAWALALYQRERPTTGISVTELIAPAQQRRLLAEYDADIEVDVMDILDLCDGTMFHESIALFAPQGALREQRLWMQIDGHDVSGAVDLFHDGVLTDHKRCKTWALRLGEQPKPEWVAQLNLYALLIEANGGGPVVGLQIEAWLKDWSETEAARDSTYPQAQIQYIIVPLWSSDHRVAFARERLAAHFAPFPESCSPAERWETPTVYAVHKPGRKSAVRLHDAADMAEAHAAQLGAGHHVQTRPGMSRRCAKYCQAAAFCPQWRAERSMTCSSQ